VCELRRSRMFCRLESRLFSITQSYRASLTSEHHRWCAAAQIHYVTKQWAFIKSYFVGSTNPSRIVGCCSRI